MSEDTIERLEREIATARGRLAAAEQQLARRRVEVREELRSIQAAAHRELRRRDEEHRRRLAEARLDTVRWSDDDG